jgi:hypothetical protein
MKKKTANATISYDPIMIGEKAEICFSKVTTANAVTIYGRIVKEGEDAGSISYDSRGNYLNCSLKPYGLLTEDEVMSVYSQVPGCIKEMLEE